MTNRQTCDNGSVPHGRSPSPARTTTRAGRRALPHGRAALVLGALALAVALTASGCGGTSAQPVAAASQATPSTAPEAGRPTTTATNSGSGTATGSCQLLTDGDVTAALRQPMKASGDAGKICSYSATADPSVVLYVQTFATPADAATDTQLESSSEHIDGLGDDAFWNATLGMVFVRNGDRAFAVTSPSLANLSADPQATNPVMVGLAKIVLRNS